MRMLLRNFLQKDAIEKSGNILTRKNRAQLELLLMLMANIRKEPEYQSSVKFLYAKELGYKESHKEFIDVFQKILDANDLFSISTVERCFGGPLPKDLGLYFTNNDARMVVNTYLHDEDFNFDKTIIRQFHNHRFMTVTMVYDSFSRPDAELSKIYSLFEVKKMKPIVYMNASGHPRILYHIVIADPLFYSFSLLGLTLNQFLLSCDKYPEDPVAKTETVFLLRELLEVYLNSSYFTTELIEEPCDDELYDDYADAVIGDFTFTEDWDD